MKTNALWCGGGQGWACSVFNSFIKETAHSSQLPWTNLHLPSAWQLRAADLLREPESYVTPESHQLQLI